MNPETAIQNRIRLDIGSQPGTRIFRNTVGKARLESGIVITFGLAPGSSDTIGWKTLEITPAMVGRRIAQFVAIEVKTPGGYTKPELLEKQKKFIAAVRAAGGLGGFAHNSKEALEILDGVR